MIKPTRNNVLVRIEKFADKTKSGLIIPYQVGERMNYPELVRAEVIAVGHGFYSSEGVFIKPYVQVGDFVFFGGLNYSGEKIEEDGVEYRMLREIDILMKEKGD